MALQVGVQQMLLLVLQQSAAGTVHDALRNAGRSGRIENVDGMVERQLDELQWRAVLAEFVPVLGIPQPIERRIRLHVGDHYYALHARELRQDLCDCRE